MNKRTLAALLLLNVVLLAGVIVTAFTPTPAQAQIGAGGQYLMISGRIQQRDQQAAVYVLNMQTGQVAAVMFNGSTEQFEPISRRNINQDLQQAGRGGR